MSAVLSQIEADALAECEAVITKGLGTFVEVGRALLVAEGDMSAEDFDLYCRVHAGAPADVVRPLLDIVRGLS